MAQKKVTLKESAQRTHVSLGTVHRAIYGKSGISEETRKRVLEEVERSNYQVDEAASVLKRGAKNVVVVLPKAQDEDRFYLEESGGVSARLPRRWNSTRFIFAW